MATKKAITKVGRRYNFRGLSHMDADVDYRRPYENRPIPQDSLLSTLFAPDHATGMPDASALLVVQNGHLDPASREMLRRRYCSPLPDDAVATGDLDSAIKYTRTRSETLNEYAERLVSDIEGSYKKNKS